MGVSFQQGKAKCIAICQACFFSGLPCFCEWQHYPSSCLCQNHLSSAHAQCDFIFFPSLSTSGSSLSPVDPTFSTPFESTSFSPPPLSPLEFRSLVSPAQVAAHFLHFPPYLPFLPSSFPPVLFHTATGVTF